MVTELQDPERLAVGQAPGAVPRRAGRSVSCQKVQDHLIEPVWVLHVQPVRGVWKLHPLRPRDSLRQEVDRRPRVRQFVLTHE